MPFALPTRSACASPIAVASTSKCAQQVEALVWKYFFDGKEKRIALGHYAEPELSNRKLAPSINHYLGRMPAMQLRVPPLVDDWALRRMLLVLRVQPPRQAPLGELAAHLDACAASVTPGQADT